ncbi:MAG: ImmA/IrrE family metallo-endopeptidase [Proteobacteria bacterium]|nr:ImmA/IrrE family metallo-endopeptidase [Pseudomonadota bacterium]MBU1715510.1 ImmA/IrrE family metallo-endopeptidase [Pseudomonadota bacterium]
MQAKIIKTETEYDQALVRIDELMDATPDTPQGDEFELLVTLVELYEAKEYAIDLPDAVSAIKFRMEQQGLKQKDLVPYIGSKSKVSEVLAGKRPLSLSMIRKLHAELGIPAAVLLQNQGADLPVIPDGLEWQGFPLAEMLNRKWINFKGTLAKAKEHAEELLAAWAAPLGADALQPTLLKQHIRGRNNGNPYSLTAWRIRVSLLALEQDIPVYASGTVDRGFMSDLVKLSYLANGPLLAKEFLLKNGIHFIVEPHLKTTHLDGAAMRLPSGAPLVALTTRHNRLDNFWFTLCHELAHLSLHLDNNDWFLFLDDLDCLEENGVENEADSFASEVLIPPDKWRESGLDGASTTAEVKSFAESQRIHPAIPAGRIRREQNNYKLLTRLIGNGEVRKLFS